MPTAMDNLKKLSYVLVNVSNKRFSGVSMGKENPGEVLLSLGNNRQRHSS